MDNYKYSVKPWKLEPSPEAIINKFKKVHWHWREKKSNTER